MHIRSGLARRAQLTFHILHVETNRRSTPIELAPPGDPAHSTTQRQMMRGDISQPLSLCGARGWRRVAGAVCMPHARGAAYLFSFFLALTAARPSLRACPWRLPAWLEAPEGAVCDRGLVLRGVQRE